MFFPTLNSLLVTFAFYIYNSSFIESMYFGYINDVHRLYIQSILNIKFML